MNESIEIQLQNNSNILYIFFGGIAAGIAMPPFEFYNVSNIINENRMFVRDFNQCWYQTGLPHISKDVYSTATYIKRKIKEINPDRVFLVGNSMGGFAAILFANLIGKCNVIAFSPQTFISPLLRFKYNDTRWKKCVFTTYVKSLFKYKVWDLKPLLLESKIKNEISIFVSKFHRLDCVHATHIECSPKVKIFKFDCSGHNIVKRLRDDGRLPAIMKGTYC